ncbi:MAG: hypothetical protein ACRECO_10765 [Xanthobacteraceae bacterium]
MLQLLVAVIAETMLCVRSSTYREADRPSRQAELILRDGVALSLGRGWRLWRQAMHGIIYLVGLIVVIMAILSFFGLR